MTFLHFYLKTILLYTVNLMERIFSEGGGGVGVCEKITILLCIRNRTKLLPEFKSDFKFYEPLRHRYKLYMCTHVYKLIFIPVMEVYT